MSGYEFSIPCMFGHIRLFVTPWTVAHQAPRSMGFPRQEYWSEWSFPSAVDLPSPGIESTSPALAGGFFTTEPPGKPHPRSYRIQIMASSQDKLPGSTPVWSPTQLCIIPNSTSLCPPVIKLVWSKTDDLNVNSMPLFKGTSSISTLKWSNLNFSSHFSWLRS